jgi:hypothetical protein
MRRLRRRARKAGPGLAFAYLFFLLFPHFAAILSAHDLVLEREALEAAPQGEPNGELAPDVVEPMTGVFQTLKIVGPGLVPEPSRAHVHFQEDPNLPALALPAYAAVAHATIVPAPETIPEFIPALAILASPARAPPRA